MQPAPISERRLTANRANALKSTGPRTAAGKRKSSQNACHHHLYAHKFSMSPEAEAANEARARRDSAHVQDPIVRELHYRLILATGHCELNWSLWDGLEAYAHKRFPGDPQMAIYWMLEEQHGFLRALHRHESFYSRQIMDILKTLELIEKPKKHRRLNSALPLEAVVAMRNQQQRTQSAPHWLPCFPSEPLPSSLRSATTAPADTQNPSERTHCHPRPRRNPQPIPRFVAAPAATNKSKQTNPFAPLRHITGSASLRAPPDPEPYLHWQPA